jgi:CDP-paratose 2-epimerase
MKDWLVTGGCGFIGTHLADALLSKGRNVTIMDNLSRIGAKDNLDWLRERHGLDWRFIESDVRDASQVTSVVKETRPYAIAHLAGQVAMTTSLQDPRADFEINTMGSLNILEAVRLHTPDSIVLYSSTNKVYGDLDWVDYEEHETRYIAPDFPNGFNEETPLNFSSPYGCSKGAADQYMLDYARIFGLKTVVFRHSSMYGGRQFATFDQGWVGWFCMKAVETQYAQKDLRNLPSFTISGNGKQVRDVLHADDVIDLYFRAVATIDNVSGKVFNIGGGIEQSLSLVELFKFLEEYLEIGLIYTSLPWRISDQKIFVADITKAHQLLHWMPKVHTRDGIVKMVEWVNQMKLIDLR